MPPSTFSGRPGWLNEAALPLSSNHRPRYPPSGFAVLEGRRGEDRAQLKLDSAATQPATCLNVPTQRICVVVKALEIVVNRDPYGYAASTAWLGAIGASVRELSVSWNPYPMPCSALAFGLGDIVQHGRKVDRGPRSLTAPPLA